MSILKDRFTVADAAEKFQKTPGRIRQICIEHEIGETVGNRIRILTKTDLKKIGDIIEETGRNRGSEKTD